ncbi:MAG TPA: amidohydrolase family protein, partial [Pirellulaceae bacterium]|nr:amidohydrolase family protein [Pirellulaceae bacterium]
LPKVRSSVGWVATQPTFSWVTQMIIDVHTHLNNYHEDRVVSIDQCLDNLLGEMEKNSVDHSLVLTSYKVTEHRPPTRDVVKATEKHDNISVVAGISFLNYKQRDLREIAEFLEAGLIKGLKLYPGYEPFYPYDQRCQVIYDLAMEFDVPVMFHTGDTYSPKGKVRFAHPLNIDDVAVDNPTMKIVICHIGNPWIRDCMEVVYKNPNVYTDVSGLTLGDFNEKFERFMRNQVKEMLTYAGEPQYMLYGTDWPICNMRSYLKFMKELKLPAASMEKIMWRNAAELFKIDVPAA